MTSCFARCLSFALRQDRPDVYDFDETQRRQLREGIKRQMWNWTTRDQTASGKFDETKGKFEILWTEAHRSAKLASTRSSFTSMSTSCALNKESKLLFSSSDNPRWFSSFSRKVSMLGLAMAQSWKEPLPLTISQLSYVSLAFFWQNVSSIFIMCQLLTWNDT